MRGNTPWVASGVIGAVLCLWPTAYSCFADEAVVSKIRLLVCDQAGVPRETLKEAQRMASFVFHEAAIELLWLDEKDSSVAEADWILRIHCCFGRLKTGLHDRTVAFAPAGGRHITVFWDRIRTEAVAGSHPEALMLGYVTAHELGHLLLPPRYHSPYGIMKNRLNYSDWSQVRRLGNLFFSDKEAGSMQAALRSRSR